MIGHKPSILIVDDEVKMCGILAEILESGGYAVKSAHNGDDALIQFQDAAADLVLLDIKLPDRDGIEVLQEMKRRNPAVPVIMISAFGTVSLAVEALKNGAEDFLEKPLETNRVLTTIRNIMEKTELRRESQNLRTEIEEKYRIHGRSRAIQQVMDMIAKTAATNSTVLITGESGVGKELVARNIHIKSRRVTKPFISVNCAALPAELIESELFGYEKGAFTGAYARKIGQFEAANNGTLFLDEIGDMPLAAQSKVLKVLEDNSILRLGNTKPIAIDVRVICATNQNLNRLMAEGKFRDDLYHRINVLTIRVPPLREREDDIQYLAEMFLNRACLEHALPPKKISPEAMGTLMAQQWPGNVRQLKNLMEKTAILVESNLIDLEELGKVCDLSTNNKKADQNRAIDGVREEFERRHILDVLNQTGWRIGETAATLGIDRSTLFRKMKKYGISRDI